MNKSGENPNKNFVQLVLAAKRGVPITEASIPDILKFLSISRPTVCDVKENEDSTAKILLDAMSKNVVFKGNNLELIVQDYVRDESKYGEYFRNESCDFLRLCSVWNPKMFETLLQSEPAKFNKIMDGISLLVAQMRLRIELKDNTIDFLDYTLTVMKWIHSASSDCFEYLLKVLDSSYDTFFTVLNGKKDEFDAFVKTVDMSYPGFIEYIERVSNDKLYDVRFSTGLKKYIERRSADAE